MQLGSYPTAVAAASPQAAAPGPPLAAPASSPLSAAASPPAPSTDDAQADLLFVQQVRSRFTHYQTSGGDDEPSGSCKTDPCFIIGRQHP